jgi:hypothetical protein
LPILVTNPGLPQPSGYVRVQRWFLDTRFTGAAFAWWHHLEEAGLDVKRFRRRKISLTALLGVPRQYPERQADLWLVSNLNGLAPRPWLLRLRHGVAFHDVQRLTDPESNAPLLGMQLLADTGLTVQVNGRHRTVSVWTPDGIWSSAVRYARRLAAGWVRTEPW